MITKTCKRCNLEKDVCAFSKYRNSAGELLRRAACRECNKPSRQKYYANHSLEIISRNSDYKKVNRHKVNERNRKRKACDLEYRLYENVRSVVKISIKRNRGKKGGEHALKYLPYSIQQLKSHLEAQFEPWMTWDNWGVYDKYKWNDDDPTTWTWQIDHIIPQSDLPYTSMGDDNFRRCWGLENLRPLSAKRNVSEGPARIRHRKVA